jgi:hypothetical protein
LEATQKHVDKIYEEREKSGRILFLGDTRSVGELPSFEVARKIPGI